MSERWRPVAFALAVLSALAVCSAQRVFRSGVSLVLVDLRVIDHDYRSVTDLGVDDVEVLVDRQPRSIVGFEYHGDDPSSTPPVVASAVGTQTPLVSQPALPSSGSATTELSQ